MSILMLPVRLVGVVVCVIAGIASVISIEIAAFGAHLPASWLIAGPAIAALSGGMLGSIYWRSSSRRPIKSLGLPVVLLAAFALVALASGARIGR